jgi:hypothetical protein
LTFMEGAKRIWTLCADARMVVVPVHAYSDYGKDGNVSQEMYRGVRFAALPFNNDAVGPDNWFMIDAAHTGPLFLTPEEALAAAVEKQAKDDKDDTNDK